jgi:hypothetical protein
VIFFYLKFCSVHSIVYNLHSTFRLRFRSEINSFLQIQFSVGSNQRATTTLDFEHVFSLLSAFSLSFAQFNPVCSCIFYFCVRVTFSSVRPIFCPTVASIFCSSWDDFPANLWISPAFSDPQNMSRDNLTSPVAAAATSQVKLCPYNEEEPHIWFRLIKAQFAAANPQREFAANPRREFAANPRHQFAANPRCQFAANPVFSSLLTPVVSSLLTPVFSSLLTPAVSSLLTPIVSSLLTLVVVGPPPSTLLPVPPTATPLSGVGGRSRAAGRSPRLAPRHPASHYGVVGEPAGQATRQSSNPSPLHPTSLASPPPTWASVVRGVAASVGEPACSRPSPSVSAADFSRLYERCMKSSLKARVAFHHAAGRQTVTVTCTLPASTTSAATAGKRRRRRHTRRGRADAATAERDTHMHPQPSLLTAAAPACDERLLGTPQHLHHHRRQ